MRTTRLGFSPADLIPDALRAFLARRAAEVTGLCLLGAAGAAALSLGTWSVRDPSINHATDFPVRNLLGLPGAVTADLLVQFFGIGAICLLGVPAFWGWRLLRGQALGRPRLRLGAACMGLLCACGVASVLPATDRWPLPTGLGGVLGDAVLRLPTTLLPGSGASARPLWSLLLGAVAILALGASLRRAPAPPAMVDEPATAHRKRPARDIDDEPGVAIVSIGALFHAAMSAKAAWRRRQARRAGEPGLLERGRTLVSRALRQAELMAERAPVPPPAQQQRQEPQLASAPALSPALRAAEPLAAPAGPRRIPLAADSSAPAQESAAQDDEEDHAPAPPQQPRSPSRGEQPAIKPITLAPASGVLPGQSRIVAPPAPIRPVAKPAAERNTDPNEYELPSLTLLAEPKRTANVSISADALEQNARLLEGVLEDFGVRGEIINVRPGPVVTLYELEPAPGIKSSRVIGLADDIARSMSAVSARVAVVQGRNAIGIELPNAKREMVFFRELLASQDFDDTKFRLPIALGKTIGGEPVIVELARMPHLLIAGTTGSGKSVAINTMILSLLYRLRPEECRLIMIDPKMLELSVYDGIPHLLTPVVTDPKKAILALKWAVREMEDRYKKMSKVAVRNIDGFNARVSEAKANGEIITRTVQTGFDRETGEAVYETEEMTLDALPYIVVIVDEMADLMMVAGKEIEGAIQRLAQMARAAGIHLIMATQRPSVDVITGTIKANFPTRISFQVTSKIDSRTILGEQGAEQLLGQGDMLHMAGGGRISRVHGPFCSDEEVEKIVAHLKTQGRPQYLESVLASDDDEGEASEEDAGAVFDKGSFGEEGGDLYDQAVRIVLRDKKCSTSYVQRRLQIGYNRAASLVERMEKEGIVGAANHAGKREILLETQEEDMMG